MPVLVGGLQQRLDHQARGVVDPDVDAAERVNRRRREPLDIFDAPGVALQHELIGAGLGTGLVDPGDVRARDAEGGAIALPIPVDAPVTTARRPRRLKAAGPAGTVVVAASECELMSGCLDGCRRPRHYRPAAPSST